MYRRPTHGHMWNRGGCFKAGWIRSEQNWAKHSFRFVKMSPGLPACSQCDVHKYDFALKNTSLSYMGHQAKTQPFDFVYIELCNVSWKWLPGCLLSLGRVCLFCFLIDGLSDLSSTFYLRLNSRRQVLQAVMAAFHNIWRQLKCARQEQFVTLEVHGCLIP